MASDTAGMDKKKVLINFLISFFVGVLLCIFWFLCVYFLLSKETSLLLLGISLPIVLLLSIALSITIEKLREKDKKENLSLLKEYMNKHAFGEYFPTLPNENEFKELLERILKRYESLLEEMREEKKKDDFLISHMRQGYLLFDEEHRIRDFNAIALKYLSKRREEVLGKDFESLKLGEDADKHYRKILSDDPSSFDVPLGEKTYLFIPSFNDKKQSEYSFALFILDVSENRMATKIRREFFQNASHELKSPLTSIIGYQELIQNGIVSEKEDLLKANSVTLSSALHMKAIVDGMFTLFGIESNVPQKKEEVDLKAMIESMVASFRPQMEKRNISLSMNLKETKIVGSAKDLSMILENLISNAIKYNNDDGLLEIKLDEKGFSVRDTGIGIQKKDLPRIFERFYIADRSRSKANDSTGLGLAIVKHLCLNNDYRVSVESTYGEGSVFSVYF